MKKFTFLLVAAFLFLLTPSLKAQDMLMIDDFSDAARLNKLSR